MDKPTQCFSCLDQSLYQIYGQSGQFIDKLRAAETEFSAYLDAHAESSGQLQIDCYSCGRVRYEPNNGRWIEVAVKDD